MDHLKKYWLDKNITPIEDESDHLDLGEDDVMLGSLFEEDPEDDHEGEDKMVDVEGTHVVDGPDPEPQLWRGQRNRHTPAHLAMFYILTVIEVIKTLWWSDNHDQSK